MELRPGCNPEYATPEGFEWECPCCTDKSDVHFFFNFLLCWH